MAWYGLSFQPHTFHRLFDCSIQKVKRFFYYICTLIFVPFVSILTDNLAFLSYYQCNKVDTFNIPSQKSFNYFKHAPLKKMYHRL